MNTGIPEIAKNKLIEFAVIPSCIVSRGSVNNEV